MGDQEHDSAEGVGSPASCVEGKHDGQSGKGKDQRDGHSDKGNDQLDDDKGKGKGKLDVDKGASSYSLEVEPGASASYFYHLHKVRGRPSHVNMLADE